MHLNPFAFSLSRTKLVMYSAGKRVGGGDRKGNKKRIQKFTLLNLKHIS